MTEYFKNIYNPDIFRNEGTKIIEILSSYLNKCINNESIPVLPLTDPDKLEDKYKKILSNELNDVAELINEIISDSNHLHHPSYIGHQVIPPAPLASLGELVSSFLNNGMAIYEMGPAATAMERIIIKWICRKAEYKNGDGFLTSGGSIGNLTAILSARQIKITELKKKGFDEKTIFDKLSVIVSGNSHYSIDRAVKILGINSANIYHIPYNKDFSINLKELDILIDEIKSDKKEIFALCINDCTTALGLYDDIMAISKICKKQNIWLHVDAAHGGAVLISKKYSYLLDGISEADSFILDFHKMMLAPALTTGVFYKDYRNSFASFEQEASYLLDKTETDFLNGAKRTLECTKKSMSFKIYLMLAIYGEKIFANFVERQHLLAEEFADLIEKSEDFALAARPQSNIVCFRFVNQHSDINELNRHIRKKIVESGEFYIVQTEISGEQYLRVSIMNPLTEINHLKGLLTSIRTIANKIVIV